MVPFTSFATGSWSYGSPKLERYNGVSSVEIQGQAAPGQSTGQAMAEMQRLMKQAARRHRLRMDRHLAAGATVGLAGAAAVRAFDPRGVPEPRRAVRELVGADLRHHGGAARRPRRARRGDSALHLENDVYFQVGLLTTIGLSSKNAILIVEFARDLEAQGKSAIEAAIEAAHLRMRPILMTSLAFVLGVLPLAHRERRRLGQRERGRPRRHRRHVERHVPRPIPDSDVLPA